MGLLLVVVVCCCLASRSGDGSGWHERRYLLWLLIDFSRRCFLSFSLLMATVEKWRVNKNRIILRFSGRGCVLCSQRGNKVEGNTINVEIQLNGDRVVVLKRHKNTIGH